MAGTQSAVEARPSYYAKFLLQASAPTTPQNTLQGGFDVDTLQNRATCWAADAAALYEWDETSTVTADNVAAILPTGHSGAGRWLFVLGQGLPVFQNVAAVDAQPSLDYPQIIMLDMPDNPGNPAIYRVGASGGPEDLVQVIDTAFGASKQLLRLDMAPGTASNNPMGASTVTFADSTNLFFPSGTWITFSGVGSGRLFSTESTGRMTFLRRMGAVVGVPIYLKCGGTVAVPVAQRIGIGYVTNDGGTPASSGALASTTVDSVSGRFMLDLFVTVFIAFGDTIRLGLRNFTNTDTVTVEHAFISSSIPGLRF